VIGRGGVIVTSIANHENGIMGGLAYEGVKLINVLASLDVGLCCARFMGSLSTSCLLEMRPAC
jgi:hypothetical protein